MAKKNIEEIRRKNLQDNQSFLKKLRINHVRNDFVQSARTILRKRPEVKKSPINYEKVEHVTRYSLKVKSGEIQPFIPKWKQKPQGKPSKWTLFYKQNKNPYQKVFKPRIRN